MLQIVVPGREYFNEVTGEFVETKPATLSMEHSLLSISKWESKWHKPFLHTDNKTPEENIDYFRCMTIGNVDPTIFYGLSVENQLKIKEYIENPMTATTFRKSNRPPSRQIITSEIIYYWMVDLGIPFECEKWNFNRLMTLIRVCQEKQTPGKKMSKRDILAQQAMLNASRLKGGRR